MLIFNNLAVKTLLNSWAGYILYFIGKLYSYRDCCAIFYIGTYSIICNYYTEYYTIQSHFSSFRLHWFGTSFKINVYNNEHR
jgi:hypothetical protein